MLAPVVHNIISNEQEEPHAMHYVGCYLALEGDTSRSLLNCQTITGN
jgi:hypothetical protein